MKIGILSDTHLTGITSEFKKVVEKHFFDVEMIIHAGDMTGRAVYDYLSNWDLKAVRGNMDDFDLCTLLPQKRVEEVMGLRIGIIHGSGAPEGIENRVLGAFDGLDIIIFGHSHVPLNTKYGGITLFNPGSFRGRYSFRGTVGLMEIGDNVTLSHIEIE